MDQRRLSMSDIVIGESLRWDVYGADRKLLLPKGHIIENAHQAESLLEPGLYVNATNVDVAPQQQPEEPVKNFEFPSVLRLFNLAYKQLERLLYGLSTEPDAQAKILDVVKAVTDATDLNHDIALGCVLLNQSAGNYSVRHCIDTAIVSLLVMRSMGKTPDEIATVMAAALTMNVGMLRYQDQLVNKQDALSDKEIEIIKKHPEESVDILKQAGIDNADWLSHVLLHHENEDGSGYPLGGNVAAISQNAKILTLADHYCASISSRKYRKTLAHNAALRDVFLAGGKARDPILAACFIKELGTHAPGTFVRLQNGEIGVVTGKGSDPATPIVHALIGSRGAPLLFPIKRDTAKPPYGVREPVIDEQQTLSIGLHELWGDAPGV
jgi:HD-GYP domain-containing protein (c-di-GMP phosphodiesterase class II)